jgi:hypothetical protein
MLSSLVFVLTNCLNDDGDNIIYFFKEPAVVKSMGTSSEKSVIRTPNGEFYVPLSEKDSVETGTLLWTYFQVDMNEKANDLESVLVRNTTNFQYEKVDSSRIIMPADSTEFQLYLSDDYTVFIPEAVLYNDYVDKLLFFGFTRGSSSDNSSLEYELIRNPKIEDENGHPTLYIRSRKSDSSNFKGQRETIYAFEMSDFIDYYKENISAEGLVKFNLKYHTGKDENGEDVYRSFKKKPIEWEIE